MARFLVLLLLMTSGWAAADNAAPPAAPHPKTPSGEYCPGTDALYVILEETASAAKALQQAREAALILDDAPAADIALGRAGAALALAAGRGAGARTATLIDATIAAKSDGHPKALLPWFPLLRSSLDSLVDDTAAQDATALVTRAEAMVQGQVEGDEIPVLRAARQLLVCDPLDIPLQQAAARLVRLHKQVMLGAKPPAEDFAAVADLLETALSYGLQRLQGLQH